MMIKHGTLYVTMWAIFHQFDIVIWFCLETMNLTMNIVIIVIVLRAMRIASGWYPRGILFAVKPN